MTLVPGVPSVVELKALQPAVVINEINVARHGVHQYIVEVAAPQRKHVQKPASMRTPPPHEPTYA